MVCICTIGAKLSTAILDLFFVAGKCTENQPSLGSDRMYPKQLLEPGVFPQRICLSSHWKKRTLCHERARGGMADAPDLGSGSERIGGSSPLARTMFFELGRGLIVGLGFQASNALLPS